MSQKTQLEEPLLFDGDVLPGIWNRRQAPPTSWKWNTFVRGLLIKSLLNIVSAVVLLILLALLCPQSLFAVVNGIAGTGPADVYKHFPLRSAIRWMDLPGDPQYWSNMVYMGEASPESDIAWNELVRRHGFRAWPTEAEQLNLTASLSLENGGVAASLGVDHNLHCLRHFKQWYFKDYYYANKSEEDVAWLESHTLHCLETLRKSVMCYPDLNLSPYYMDPEQTHHPTHISTWGRRQCVDYDVLNTALDARRYPRSEYGEEVNRLLEASG